MDKTKSHRNRKLISKYFQRSPIGWNKGQWLFKESYKERQLYSYNSILKQTHFVVCQPHWHYKMQGLQWYNTCREFSKTSCSCLITN